MRNLAVAAGATPNQTMHSFKTPEQQQFTPAPVYTPVSQTNAIPQQPWAMSRRRPERVATHAGLNAGHAQMQQQRSEHYEAAQYPSS